MGDRIALDEVRRYWGKKNIPQQWYSKKQPFTLAWFNELAYKRFNIYYEHLRETAEFEWHGGEEVLEIGCGIGTDAIEFARHGARVTAVDLGADQVMLTKLNFELHGLTYADIREANAEHLPFPDETFDFVYSFGVIHHTPDTQRAVAEIFRVLKQDGTAVVMVYARGWKHYLKRCFVHGLLLGKWIRHEFNWQRVYNEVSEVHGSSPKTNIYTKRGVRELFSSFATVDARKKRLGEFFEYKPYNTAMFPLFVRNSLRLLNLESWVGENWMVRAQKCRFPKEARLWEVWFKHY